MMNIPLDIDQSVLVGRCRIMVLRVSPSHDFGLKHVQPAIDLIVQKLDENWSRREFTVICSGDWANLEQGFLNGFMATTHFSRALYAHEGLKGVVAYSTSWKHSSVVRVIVQMLAGLFSKNVMKLFGTEEQAYEFAQQLAKQIGGNNQT